MSRAPTIQMLPGRLVFEPVELARAINADRVKQIAESIQEIGLLHPIIVTAKKRYINGAQQDAYEILVGTHRYRAMFDILKWEDIPATVHTTDDLHAELVVIDENLCRAELSDAERASQLRRRKEIYLILHPETAAGVAGGKARQGAATEKFSFAENTAKATGVTPRSVRMHVARADALGDATLAKVKGTSLDKGVELDALAKLPEPERENIVRLAAEGHKVSARKPVSPAADPLNNFEAREKQVAALMAAWNKASAEAREEFLSRIDHPVMDRRFG